ncbi:MAG: hypothetical protein M3O66_08085, partial [Verrucomicrobiota bacterium]|nr:hypothetical protein [Verrucomicrobiota bacterium]
HGPPRADFANAQVAEFIDFALCRVALIASSSSERIVAIVGYMYRYRKTASETGTPRASKFSGITSSVAKALPQANQLLYQLSYAGKKTCAV